METREPALDDERLMASLCSLGLGDDDSTSAFSQDNTTTSTLEHGSSACSRVFAIPELLSLILSFVSPIPISTKEELFTYQAEDPRSAEIQARVKALWALLHSQRVNQSWRDAIQTTVALQQCLYNTPQTTNSASWTVSATSSWPVLNPLIQTITHWRFSHLNQIDGMLSAHMIIEREDYQHLLTLPTNQKAMLLSQPPVTLAQLLIWDKSTEPESGEARTRPPSSFYSVKHARDDGGIIFGKLLHILGQMFDEDAMLKAVKICT